MTIYQVLCYKNKFTGFPITKINHNLVIFVIIEKKRMEKLVNANFFPYFQFLFVLNRFRGTFRVKSIVFKSS